MEQIFFDPPNEEDKDLLRGLTHDDLSRMGELAIGLGKATPLGIDYARQAAIDRPMAIAYNPILFRWLDWDRTLRTTYPEARDRTELFLAAGNALLTLRRMRGALIPEFSKEHPDQDYVDYVLERAHLLGMAFGETSVTGDFEHFASCHTEIQTQFKHQPAISAYGHLVGLEATAGALKSIKEHPEASGLSKCNIFNYDYVLNTDTLDRISAGRNIRIVTALASGALLLGPVIYDLKQRGFDVSFDIAALAPKSCLQDDSDTSGVPVELIGRPLFPSADEPEFWIIADDAISARPRTFPVLSMSLRERWPNASTIE